MLSFIYIRYLLRKFLLGNFKPQKNFFIHRNIPYFSQWESRNLIKHIIDKKISAKDDPLWINSGAKSKEEYELWSWNGCGMACLKMILAYEINKTIPLIELGQRCKEYGGYKGENLEGLFYKPFVKFLKEEFKINSRIISPMTIIDIVRELEENHFVIASVSYEIRNPTNKPSFRGGHLVLVVGFDMNEKALFIHNPSGTDKKTQEFHKVSFSDFNKLFAYRGISIE